MKHDFTSTVESPEVDEQQSAPDLRSLDDDYEIFGELRGSAAIRYYVARRTSDRTDVLIAVAGNALGGENNALAHLASDAQLLEAPPHPAIASVIEGRWLGRDHFAVVSERVHGATLHEVLSANGPFPNPRIATALQEVNAALASARGRGLVHRGVTPESLYFDPDTNRPRVVLALTPIPLEGLPDAAADARTIGELAWAMLAGRPHSVDAPPLDELQPELAKRVVEETTAMVNLANDVDVPDVDRFLSVIAMGDALREGEREVARIQAEMTEERYAERRRVEELERAFDEHVAIAQKQLANERSQLERERSEFSDRVTEFELRASIEGPAVATMMPRLPSEWGNDDVDESRSRFGWLIPVGTIALLVLLAFGALFARHRPASHAVTVTQSRGSVGAKVVRPAAKQP